MMHLFTVFFSVFHKELISPRSLVWHLPTELHYHLAAGKASVVCAHVAEPFEIAFLNLAQDDLVQISQHVIVLILHCHFDTIRRMDKP